MQYTIQSRVAGTVTFFAIGGSGGYIYVNLNHQDGVLGTQLYKSSGAAICHAGDYNSFVKAVKAYWRRFLAERRDTTY